MAWVSKLFGVYYREVTAKPHEPCSAHLIYGVDEVGWGHTSSSVHRFDVANCSVEAVDLHNPALDPPNPYAGHQ